jgi:peptide/nickel transport system substrate-binding protein
LKTGEIHVMEGIPPHELAGLVEDSGVQIKHFPYAQYVQIAWNLNNTLFKDKHVRKALTHAIDRAALVEHLLKGYGVVCAGPIHPILWASETNLEPLPFSPEKAKGLLAQAGWRDTNDDGILDDGARDFEFKLLTNIGSQLREDAQVMIQEMLRQVGVCVIPQRLEWSVYVERLMSRNFDAVLIGMMTATKVDVFPAWHSTMIGPDGFNLSCYTNVEVDRLIERSRQIADREEALPLFDQFQNIIADDQPATFLWVPDRIVALDANIVGCRFSPVSTFFNIHQWAFE